MRGRLLVAALAAWALFLGGCSSDEAGDTGGSWPLTGLAGYPAESQAQVLTVKVDDTSSGRPQVGLDRADLVVQQMVEGGVTRLAVMFHSTYPDAAGPVRSVRETDIGVVLPTAGTLAASGGAQSTLDAVASAGIPIAVEGDSGFSRDSARPAPYNLMLDVAALAATLPPGPPPGPYLDFGPVPPDAHGEPAGAIDLVWPAAEASFSADPATGLWTRADLPEAEGGSFTNVVGLSLPVTYTSGNDSSGAPIPTMVTEGTGAGMVATGGQAFEIEWSKPSPQSPWSLSYTPVGEGSSGEAQPLPFTVPPGRTWLALLPEEGGTTQVTPPASPSPTE